MIRALRRLLCPHPHTIKEIQRGVLGLRCARCGQWQAAKIERSYAEIQQAAKAREAVNGQ